MIEDREEFEEAISRAVERLAHPPAPGTQEHRSFLALLEDIESFQPEVEAQTDPIAGQLADLETHLADFRRRHPDLLPPEERPHAIGPGFAFGRDLRGH